MVNFHVVGNALFHADSPQSTVSTSNTVSLSDKSPSSSSASDKGDAKTTDSGKAPSKEALLGQAYAVLTALKEKNYPALSGMVHPQKGLTFTPYSTVDFTKDRKLSAEEISKLGNNPALFVWGLYDGSGAPIQLSNQAYFDQYVYNADYYSAATLGINTVLSVGNSNENVAAAYPEGEFVEFYLSGIDPKNNGFDWCGLKLVFERVAEDYKLVGLIHSEWTI